MTKQRHLYIDGQILQTVAFDRGMGKYVVCFLRELFERSRSAKNEYESITLLFNKNLCSVDQIKTIKDIIHSDIQYVILDLPGRIDNGNQLLNEDVARKELDRYFDDETSTEDIDYLMTAPFFVGFPSVFPTLSSIQKVAIVYDITPHKIWHLQKIFPDDIYFHHYGIFAEADVLCTISESVKQDLITVVGIPAEKICAIDGGPMTLIGPNGGSVAENMSFKTPYVLMVSAPIIHKNNARAVRAFKLFNERHNGRFTLYITSTFSEDQQGELKDIDSSIVFTGNISDSDLLCAYQGSSVVLFASLAEGLGMPVLEASIAGGQVACSDIPVLKELGEQAFWFFDPTDVDDISRVMAQAVKGVDNERHGRALKHTIKKYTWERTAVLFEDAVSRFTRSKEGGIGNEVAIEVDSLSGGSASSLFANMLAMHLRCASFGVSIRERRVSTRSRSPAFAKYITSRSRKQQVIIRLMDVGVPLLADAVKICVSDKIERVGAKKIWLDSALELKGWDFGRDTQGVLAEMTEMMSKEVK